MLLFHFAFQVTKNLMLFRLFLNVLSAFCHTVLLHDFPNFPNVTVHFYKQNVNHSCLPSKTPIFSPENFAAALYSKSSGNDII